MKSILGLPKYVLVALAILFMGLVFLIATTNRNPLHIYLLPENFIGKVEITFEQADFPPLEKEKNTYIYHVPLSGMLKTSTIMKSGPVEVYYVDNHGQRKKVSDNEFHGVSSGGTDNLTIAHFFIGTKEKYDNYLKQLR